MTKSKIIQVFIASSSELKTERKMMNQIFSEINGVFSHVQFKDVLWETHMSSGLVAGDYIQEDINEKLLDDCPVVILLLYSKIGEFTREEYDLALRKRKKLFVYFKEGFVPTKDTDLKNLGILLDFKSEVEKDNKILYKSFFQPIDLELLVHRDLLLYLHEEHLLADDSIMKVFEALKLPSAEKRYLECLAMLPLDYYHEAELSKLIQIPAAQMPDLSKALKSLEKKGVLSLSTDGKELYRVQETIWKNLRGPELYDKEDFNQLVAALIQRIHDMTIVTAASVILFTEKFLRNLSTHNRLPIGQLKEALAKSYINLLKSKESLEKARLLLQQLIDQQVLDTQGQTQHRKRLLAEVCVELYDLDLSDKRNQFLIEAKELLRSIATQSANLTDTWEQLRFHYVALSIDFKLDSFSIDQNSLDGSPKKRLEKLFADNPEYLDAIKLEPSNLFINYFTLCKNLKANELAEKIILKVAKLAEAEHGLGSLRLYKTYLDCCEILILNGKEAASKTYLRKAKDVADQNKSPDAPDLPLRVEALIAEWTKKFVLNS